MKIKVLCSVLRVHGHTYRVGDFFNTENDNKIQALIQNRRVEEIIEKRVQSSSISRKGGKTKLDGEHSKL